MDKDEDGASNGDEMIAGTSPNDATDIFRILNGQALGENYTINWPSVAGKNYQLFWATDISSTNWVLHSSHTGTGSELSEPLNRNEIDGADGTNGNLTALFVRITVSVP